MCKVFFCILTPRISSMRYSSSLENTIFKNVINFVYFLFTLLSLLSVNTVNQHDHWCHLNLRMPPL